MSMFSLDPGDMMGRVFRFRVFPQLACLPASSSFCLPFPVRFLYLSSLFVSSTSICSLQCALSVRILFPSSHRSLFPAVDIWQSGARARGEGRGKLKSRSVFSSYVQLNWCHTHTHTHTYTYMHRNIALNLLWKKPRIKIEYINIIETFDHCTAWFDRQKRNTGESKIYMATQTLCWTLHSGKKTARTDNYSRCALGGFFPCLSKKKFEYLQLHNFLALSCLGGLYVQQEAHIGSHLRLYLCCSLTRPLSPGAQLLYDKEFYLGF